MEIGSRYRGNNSNAEYECVYKDNLEGWTVLVMTSASGRKYSNIFYPIDFNNFTKIEPVETRWINIYPDSSSLFKTKEEADEYAWENRIACLKVEFKKGDGL